MLHYSVLDDWTVVVVYLAPARTPSTYHSITKLLSNQIRLQNTPLLHFPHLCIPHICAFRVFGYVHREILYN